MLLGLLASLFGHSAAPPQASPASKAAPRLVETFARDLDMGPGGLSVDARGNVYLADFGAVLGDPSTAGTKILRLAPDGTSSVFATGFVGASGNVFDAQGRLYQSNIGIGTLSRVAPDGSVSLVTREGLASPVGVGVDEEGYVFIANCGSSSLRVIAPDGESSEFCASPLLNCPNGLVLDEQHNLYVTNYQDGRVIRISPVGEASVLATLPGGNNGHLMVHDGALLVIARSAHQIWRVTFDGEASLFAGTGERGHGDGPALEATFSFPNDLDASPDGRFLYVNEQESLDGPPTALAPTCVRRIQLKAD